MVKATTRARRGNDKASPSKVRGPNRCRRCANRPLRSECPHTPTGREFLEKRKQLQDMVSSTQKTPKKCRICEGRPPRSKCIHTKTGLAFLREQEILTELGTQVNVIQTSLPPQTPSQQRERYDSSRRVPATPTSTVSTPTPPSNASAPPDLLSHSSRDASPLLFQAASDVIPRDFNQASPADPSATLCIDPKLLPGSGSLGANAELAGGTAGMADNASLDPTSRQTAKSDYVRATKQNPKHGWVNGAGRGSKPHDVFRKHPLPDVSTDQKAASKRFLENINRLIEKCEDLAHATGCWLFMGAQHANSQGATLHYTSPRLARDAPNEIGAIIGDFHTLSSQLLQARRTDALSLQRELKEAQEENRVMAKDKDDLAAKVDRMQDIILEFAERLGLNISEVDALQKTD